MSERIAVPNRHGLYDPPFAASQMAEHFQPWLTVGRDMVQYGADLLLRALAASKNSVPDLVIIGSLYRQVLVAGDGCLICLEAAGVQQAMMHARGIIEGSWALQFALAQDKNRWARQYYVSTVRQNRSWQRRLVPGTPEAIKSADTWKALGGVPSIPAYDAESVQRDLDEAERLLNHPEYREINKWFEQYGLIGKGRKQRFREPNWYEPGPDGVRSFAEMAHRIGREAEYDTYYRYLSYFTHGSHADNHFRVDEGAATVEPIRYPKQFSLAFNLPFVDLAADMLHIATAYRAEELPAFRQRYKDSWSPALMNHARVEINATVVGL